MSGDIIFLKFKKEKIIYRIYIIFSGAIDKFVVKSAKLKCHHRVGLIKMGEKLGGCSGERGFKKKIKTRPGGFPQKLSY